MERLLIALNLGSWKMNITKTNIILWRVVFEPHLLISFLYVVLGVLIAARQGIFSLPLFLMTLIGAVVSQIAANTYDEYFDHRIGTDLITEKTPYSGGGRIIFPGGLAPRDAFILATVALIVSFFFGVYLAIVSGWELIPLFFLGGFAGTFYSTIWQRNGLGEFMLCVIGLIVMGAYFVQTGYYSVESVAVAIPSGMLIANLVIMNEVPDAEADAATGRRNVTTTLGRTNAINAYALIGAVIYIWVVAAALLRITPPYTVISLLSAPLIYSSFLHARRGLGDRPLLIRALRNNIIGMYVFIILMVAAYLV